MKNNKLINNLMKNNKIIDIIVLVILTLVILYLLNNLFSKTLDNFENSVEPEPETSGNISNIDSGSGVGSEDNDEDVINNTDEIVTEKELNEINLPMRINLNFKGNGNDYVIIKNNNIKFYKENNKNILTYGEYYVQPIVPITETSCPSYPPQQTEIVTDNNFTIGFQNNIDKPHHIYIKDNNDNEILTYNNNSFVMYDYKGRKIASNSDNKTNIYNIETNDNGDDIETELVKLDANNSVNNVSSAPVKLSNKIFSKLNSLLSESISSN